MSSRILSLLCVAMAVMALARGEENRTSYLKAQSKGPDYTINDIWLKHQHLPTFPTVSKLVNDTFDYLPKQYLDTKNPCWMVGESVKCLPYFQILGVSKCGTTDLYHRLTYHEDLVECSWKGPHFWDESSCPSKSRGEGKYNGSFPAYVGIFDKAAEHLVKHPDSITGEASSNTFTAVKTYLRGHRNPKVLAGANLAHYLYETTPFSRFIVLFRDPVERYFSAFHYYRPKKLGRATVDEFHRRASIEMETWKSCVLSEKGEDACVAAYNPQQLVKGMYSLFVDDWVDTFGRDKLLFLKNEDYQAAPREHVEAAVSFLGMSPLPEKQWSRMLGMATRNVQRKGSMLNSTRELLQDFFRPYNQRLVEKMGGDKRWLWGY